jgi:hypothetical protein
MMLNYHELKAETKGNLTHKNEEFKSGAEDAK